MQNILTRPCTECTRDVKKSKIKITSLAEKRSQISKRWESLAWPIRRASRIQVEEGIITMRTCKKKSQMPQHWSWMWTWGIKLTGLPFTERMKTIFTKLPKNLPESTIWTKKVSRNFCNCLRWNWTTFWRKLMRMRKEMGKNTIMRIDINEFFVSIDLNKFILFLHMNRKSMHTSSHIIKWIKITSETI